MTRVADFEAIVKMTVVRLGSGKVFMLCHMNILCRSASMSFKKRVRANRESRVQYLTIVS